MEGRGAAVAGSLRWHVPEDPRISKSCLGVLLGEELARQAQASATHPNFRRISHGLGQSYEDILMQSPGPL
jgi:hypothetical protein